MRIDSPAADAIFVELKLRTVLKIILPRSPLRVAALRVTLASLALAAPLLAPAPARAETTYYTTRALLTEFFPKSERVTYRTFTLDASLRTRLAQRLGYAPAKDRYTIYVATTQGKIDGYALVDEERGLHQPITFATRLSPRGAIERLEIVTYREPRGDEVRDARFRKQFEGKTAQDPLRLNQDIDAVSGATVSSASLAVGVRRAAVLVEELALGLSTVASGPPPPAGNGATRPAAVSR
jgi:electron transport complex protein RnfG